MSAKLRLIKQALEPLPFNLYSYIIGPNGFLQWCTECEGGKIYALGSLCKNGCGEILCEKHKKYYICSLWETCDKMVECSMHNKSIFALRYLKIDPYLCGYIWSLKYETTIKINKFNLKLSSHT